MDTDLRNFRYAIQHRYRLPPERPTTEELNALLKAARAQPAPISEAQWDRLVAIHVRYNGPMYLREGVDFSDLNALLAVAVRRMQRSKRND